MRRLLERARNEARRHVAALIGAGCVTALVGGYCAHKGSFDRPLAATSGLFEIGTATHYAGSPEIFRTDADVLVQYDVEVSESGEKTVRPRWFRIGMGELLASGPPVTRDRFEEHPGPIPSELRAIMRKVRHQYPLAGGWPETLTTRFGDCVVRDANSAPFYIGTVVADCLGERVEVPMPELLPSHWTEHAWWRNPAIVLGLPFAVAFDVVVMPLNLAVVLIFALPLMVSRFRPVRRYFWICGLIVVAVLELFVFLVLFLPRGSNISGPLGNLAGLALLMRVAALTFIVPFVTGIAVARQTRRAAFYLVGTGAALVCVPAIWSLLFFGERFLDQAQSLPRWLQVFLSPLTVVPCTLALVVVLIGARWARAESTAR